MFTGIIQNLGYVQTVEKKNNAARIAFRFKNKEKKVKEGESIAVNGVCLTATNASSGGFTADLLPETLSATNLSCLSKGDWVNLERSLRQGDAIGGHFVTGHVDAMGEIAGISRRGKNWSLLVRAPKNIISKLAVKGSVACDGISLTVQKLEKNSFYLAIIPHTLAVTTLGNKKAGSRVNLEIDVVMRYLERLKPKSSLKKMAVSELLKQGF